MAEEDGVFTTKTLRHKEVEEARRQGIGEIIDGGEL
jgi:hypothetical protein